MSYDYQIAVIGGGSGGLTVAAGAASFGASVALIERKSELGGDCLHYGCMPSKAMIEAAREVHQAGLYSDFSESDYDRLFTGAMERVADAVKDVQNHDSKDRFIKLGIDIYEAEAQFIDEHTLQVGEETISAKRFVIATGSSPVVPPIEGIDSIDYLTNESIFSLRKRPTSLGVIGGGIIGSELAQAMSRLGVDVTVVEGGQQILAKEDKEITELAEGLLSEEMNVITGAKVERLESTNEGVKIHYTKEGSANSLNVEKLLVATGRKANIDGLGLEQAGVETSNGSIAVDAAMRTTQRHIYAVGDCNGSMPFTHVAGMEGKIAVSNAVFGLSRKASYEKVPWVVYTGPEIYHLGLTEEEAKEQYGEKLLTFKTKLADNDRFMAERHTDGLVKVLTTNRGRIVGAHAIGEGAGEWMQEIGTVQALNKKFQAISNIIHPYPAKNNVVTQTADLYWREKLFDSSLNEALKWYVRKFR
ncbi:pyridine nucleotide-disulfide oxidoreductase [Halobacillus halophilus]|uniref:FAD-dependent oxidoreductase n=1 Tax=Halobacillus halophilus (strain ATCC 35676 / DSM 2266 / JCM 20832 / KCTC 3685 / LMG 17431 / NBRC 102448 / NCIMB 2269) TaxID=866895 RepID=I0JK18_HALH3|nr:NAD(P)/FAD-dependent oxidoreductase [Halobacillus halophilus]ASF38636.1 pyridine nucleotide-disulfide oxidoreductase [Halobacillus halophilus]CCG44487.1 FAD-dependent oxidoreductase [Halobacillus halophilus DSM 2266]